jgi:hypothetical protein
MKKQRPLTTRPTSRNRLLSASDKQTEVQAILNAVNVLKSRQERIQSS